MSEKPYRILIIEDSPEDREFYRRRIAQGREQDFQFWETDSGAEGLRLCKDLSPDCVLLDYQLPDLNGLEFLDHFPMEFDGTQVPIIMLTGNGSEAVAVQAMKKGIHDYLIKGLNSDGLRQVVQGAIDKGILLRQVAAQRQELERLSTERLSLIAELKQQSANLADANRRKDDFLAMLGHELRNPLAPLRNMLVVMQIRGVQDPAVAEARAVMERQVIQLSRLVDDLLDVSRITHGRIELRKEPVDVTELLMRTVATNQSFLDTRSHTVIIDRPSRSLYVDADPVRLEQILANLLNNSAKYTDPGGQIKLTATLEDEQAVIRVVDNGVGIAADLLPRVFDLFTQGVRSLDRSQGGLGLGLTLVKSLVESHGGTVHVFSDGPGKGSEFVVRLPALVKATRSQSAKPSNITSSPPRRILVVDDNVDAAETLATLLRLEGNYVCTFYDGPTVLQHASAERPDVVLLDIGLPGMDGYEVARNIRQIAGLDNVLVVALTGYGQQEDRRLSEEAGFDGHAVKPVDLDYLHDILRSSRKPTGHS